MLYKSSKNSMCTVFETLVVVEVVVVVDSSNSGGGLQL